MTDLDGAMDLLKALPIERADVPGEIAPWGDLATLEQVEDATAILDPDGPPYAWRGRARGYSKSTDAAGLGIVAMTALPPGSRGYILAADGDQGRRTAEIMAGIVRRVPLLRARLELQTSRIVDRARDVELVVLAADLAGAWGLRPRFVLVDELTRWSDTPTSRGLWQAVWSSAAKLRGCRLAVLATASDPRHWSRRILDAALASPMWNVRELSGPPPWVSAEALEEQKRMLPESEFAQLWENRWVEDEDALASRADVEACVALPGPLDPVPGTRYAVGLDIGFSRANTVALTAHRAEDGRVVVDRVQVWSPGRPGGRVDLTEVESAVEATCRTYNGATLIPDPYEARAMGQRLTSRGIEVREYNFGGYSVTPLAVGLHTALRDRRVLLPDDEALVSELASVRLETNAFGGRRIAPGRGGKSDRAIALALALHHLTESREYHDEVGLAALTDMAQSLWSPSYWKTGQ